MSHTLICALVKHELMHLHCKVFLNYSENQTNACKQSFLAGGFLITQTNKGLCLSTGASLVVLRSCNESDPSQQWIWTSARRLNHMLESRCMWVDQRAAVPRHTRLVKLSDCDTAPAWKCYDNQGIFGLAETSMFLKKQGMRVVVRSEQRYSNWSMMTMDSKGRRVTTSLCPTTGQLTSFPSHTSSLISMEACTME